MYEALETPESSGFDADFGVFRAAVYRLLVSVSPDPLGTRLMVKRSSLASFALRP